MTTPAERAYKLVNGFRAAQLVRAAAEFGIPDLIATGANTVEQMAGPTGIEAARLRRLLRGLIAIGVVAENAEGSFTNTEVGELFRRDIPGSRRSMAMYLMPESYRAWEHLVEALRTGVTGQELAWGMSLWELIKRNPDYGTRFNQAMASNSDQVARAVAGCIDPSNTALIIDVGGGQGALMAGILRAIPSLRGVVCDLRAGLVETPSYLRQVGVADRCTIQECDFFEGVPGGGDVYLLKDIIHDWPDEEAARILSVCRKAMRPGARLMIVERLVPSRVTQDFVDFSAVMADLMMMVHFGSRERTLEEFRTILDTARFALEGATPAGPYKVVEALAR